MRNPFVLGLLICLAACTKPQGQSVGNGGGPLGSLFEQGRTHASQVLLRLNLEGDSNDVALLRGIRERLSNDIASSPHVWGVDSGLRCGEACGCTLSSVEASPIYFNSTSCEPGVKGRAAAARTLVHESVHHLLGENEAQADRIAGLVYQLWMEQGHPDEPHWQQIFTPPSDLTSNPIASAGSAQEFWVLFDTGSYQWQPASGRWKFTDALNREGFWAKRRASFDENSAFSFKHGDKLLVVNTAWEPGKLEPIVAHDLTKKRWIALDPGDAPASRHWASVQASADSIAVWGGVDSQGRPLSDGAVYDLASGTWKALPAFPLAKRLVPAVAWNGERLAVWGGSVWDSVADDWKTTANGAVFDRKTGSWQVLRAEGAPSARTAPLAVWMGNDFMVYGGSTDSARGTGPLGSEFFAASGGRWDASTGKWRTINTEGAPKPAQLVGGPPILPVWTGSQWLVIGDVFAAYNPLTDVWDRHFGLVHPSMPTRATAFWSGLEMVYWNPDSGKAYAFYP